MRKVLKRLGKCIFYVIVNLVVVALLFVIGFFLYFQSSATKVISGFPGMGDLRIEFDRVDTDIIANYPYGNLSLENFKVIDASDSKDEKYIVAVNEISLDIENCTWEHKRLSIKHIRLDCGEIYIHRDSLGHFNFNDIFEPAKSSSDNTESKRWSVNTDSLQVDLNHTLLSYVTDDKHQSIIALAKSGRANIYQNADGTRRISTLLDLNINDFTLNKDNGSFLKNATVSGQINLHIKQDGIHIDQTTLAINDQNILASAVFYKKNEKYSYLHFINNTTDFEAIKLLLSPNLQTTLEPFRAEGKFKADARLTIMPTHPLRVDIDFMFPGNTLYIRNQVFYNTKLSGHFVNDKVNDETFNKIITDRGYIRFDIDDAKTISNNAEIDLNNAVILAGNGRPATITSNAQINGPTELISSKFNNNKFLFNGGTFDIDAKLKGQINNIQHLIKESDLDLIINNCNVEYLPSQVVLPLQTLLLNKESGDVSFNITGLTDDQDYSLDLDGTITNLMGIVDSTKNIKSITNVNLRAKRLSWEDFIHILGQGAFNKVQKTPFEKRRDMKQTLKGFQDHFQPSIYFTIDSSGYYDYVSMENITAHMHFPDKDVLVIDSAALNLEKGHIDFSCNIDISTDELTPFDIYFNAVDINVSKLLPAFEYFGIDDFRNLNFLPKDFDIKMRLSGVIDDSIGIVNKSLKGDIIFNSTMRRVEYAHINFDRVDRFDSLEYKLKTDLVTTIKIKGNPLVFNSYLNNDQFFFNDGHFELDVNYTGDTISLDNIISDGEFDLTIDSSYVYYEPLSVTFPLTNIDLIVKENNAKYSILMQSDSLNQEIIFEGEVQNISEIIIEDTGKPVRTTSNIYSPRVTWKNFIDIFDTGPSEMEIQVDTDETTTKTSTGKFCELLYSFSPDIILCFDTLEYSNELCIHNFSTELLLVDSTFYITDAKLDYRDSDILMNSIIYISDDIDSIDSKLIAKTIDIEHFISDIEDLTKKDFSSVDYMTGTLAFDADIFQSYKGNGDGQIRDTIINGEVNFTINNLIIDDAPWMKKIGRKILLPNRFKNVKFAPISNHLSFINDTFYVPLMEVQSSAFDAFIEGHYHREHPNIWLSIPLFNLKRRDLSVVPKKEGYARRKAKIHLEYGHHKKSEPNFKLRLSKRKFFKDRGRLNEWKKMKKSER